MHTYQDICTVRYHDKAIRIYVPIFHYNIVPSSSWMLALISFLSCRQHLPQCTLACEFDISITTSHTTQRTW